VQLYFAAQLPSEAIIHLLEQELEARRDKLAECEAIAASSLDDPAASREQRMHRLVVELVMRREQTYLNWLNNAIETLRSLPE
jgi:PadR family transcriptional regulator, regulatory protein AphA